MHENKKFKSYNPTRILPTHCPCSTSARGNDSAPYLDSVKNNNLYFFNLITKCGTDSLWFYHKESINRVPFSIIYYVTHVNSIVGFTGNMGLIDRLNELIPEKK